MKIWTSEHIFDHPWETVVKAAWRKYPNPLNPSVNGVDVVDRHVDERGVLKTHRLMCTSWNIPEWAGRMIGLEKNCHASEHSEVDPHQKTMTLRTRNLTFCNYVTIDESLVYSSVDGKTHLKQEAVVKVRGIPLSSYMERLVTDTISQNANKGRQAMEWVITKVKNEANELRQEAQQRMNGVIPPPSETSSL